MTDPSRPPTVDPTRPDHPGTEPGSGREQIEHVVVLMLENRSFDHLLGYLDHPSREFPHLADLRPSCPVDPAVPGSRLVPTEPTATPVLGVDPDHSYESVRLQIFGTTHPGPDAVPTMSGFVKAYGLKISDGSLKPPSLLQRIRDILTEIVRRVGDLFGGRRIRTERDEIMRCFPPGEVPVLAHLAREYAVMVNWHASVPGETWPNRQFAHAATSHGTADIVPGFYTDRTVFERLADAGQSWGIYHDGVAQVWAYPRLWTDGTDDFHDMDRLLEDIAGDRLPTYSFVEPNHGYSRGEGNSQHPANNLTSGQSFTDGEALMATIHDALVDAPEVFAKTLFLITYDEHGGFFDHVPPRPVEPPDDLADSRTGFTFRLSGVRVPAIAVSPLVPRGHVDTTFYEHAAIPALLRSQFTPDAEPLTRREKAANDLLDHLPLLSAPRQVARVPRRERPRARPESLAPQRLDGFQASLIELAGAVHTVRDRRTESLRSTLQFKPDPACQSAADARVLTPGSVADKLVTQQVAAFSGPSEPT